jgi:signal transduction histidine kinase
MTRFDHDVCTTFPEHSAAAKGAPSDLIAGPGAGLSELAEQGPELGIPDQATIDSPEATLCSAVMNLARRNEALEEFAALVAHEVKAPLHAALATDEPSAYVRRALDLVDALLELAQEAPERGIASPAACLDGALRDLGSDANVTRADLPPRLPLPPAVLQLLLRNLLSNAVAAGAGSVRVSADHCSDTWLLAVEDDGMGLNADARYRAGSGLGLRLCRRIASRYGGSLVLAPSPTGGTQARLELGSAA